MSTTPQIPAIQEKSQERKLYKVFIWSLVLKGLNAVAECAIGLTLLFITPNEITKLAVILTQGELVEDPDNPFANYIVTIAHNFSINSHTFLISYLLIHGIIKLFLIGGLLLDKKWSYPLAMVILSLFVVFQLFQYFSTPSAWLLVLTLFDLFILGLVYNEYRYGRKIRVGI